MIQGGSKWWQLFFLIFFSLDTNCSEGTFSCNYDTGMSLQCWDLLYQCDKSANCPYETDEIDCLEGLFLSKWTVNNVMVYLGVCMYEINNYACNIPWLLNTVDLQLMKSLIKTVNVNDLTKQLLFDQCGLSDDRGRKHAECVMELVHVFSSFTTMWLM